MYITGIGQAFLELLSFEVGSKAVEKQPRLSPVSNASHIFLQWQRNASMKK